MKKSILTVLIGGTLLSMASTAQAQVGGDFQCGPRDYINGGASHDESKADAVCNRINDTRDQVGFMNDIIFGGRPDSGFGNNQGWYDKEGNLIVDKYGKPVEGHYNDSLIGRGYLLQRQVDAADEVNAAAWTLAAGGVPFFENGEFAGFVDEEGKKVVGPNGELLGSKEHGGLYSEARYKFEAVDNDIAQLNTRFETTATDFDRRITNNSKDIQKANARNDAAWELMFGGTPHLDDNGNFDGFLRKESDKLVVGPNGEFYGYKENAGLYGGYALKQAEQDKQINKNTARIDGNDKRIETLQEVKADKTDLADLETRGEEAYNSLNGRVESITNVGKVALAGAVKLGDYVKANGSDIKTNIEGKFNTAIDNSVTNVINTEGSKLNVAINGAKDTANDFDERITANKNRIDDQAGRIGKVEDTTAKNTKDIAQNTKNIGKLDTRVTAAEAEAARLEDVKADRSELAALESKGTEAYASLNGKVDNAINVGGDRLTVVEGDVAHINNQISTATDIAKSVKAKVDIAIDNSDLIVEGANNALTAKIDGQINAKIDNAKTTIINNGDDIKTAIDAKVENVTNNIAGDVLAQIGDIVIDNNNETVVNIKNEISKDVTNQLKLDAKDIAVSIKKDIVEGNNETVNNISAKLGEKAKDFQDQIDGLEDRKADRTELADLEARGTDIAGKLGDRVTTVEGDINTINGKIDHATNVAKTVKGKVDVAIDNAGDITTAIDNSLTAKIDGRIDNKIDATKTTIINNKEGIKGAVNVAYEGAKTDITNSVLNTIQKGDNEIVVNIKNDIKKEIDNSITGATNDLTGRIDMEVGRGEGAYNELNAKIENIQNGTEVDLDGIRASIQQNTASIETNVARGEVEAARLEDKKADRAELAALEAKGNEAYVNLGDKVTTLEGDVNHINNQIDYVQGNVSTWINDGKEYVWNSIAEKVEILRGQASLVWNQNKGDVINNVNQRVESYTTNVVEGLKLDAKNAAINIGKGVVNGDNNIANSVGDIVIGKGKDFQDQIDATNDRIDTAYNNAEQAAVVVADKGKAFGALAYTKGQEAYDKGQNAYTAGVNEANRLETVKADRTDLDDLRADLEGQINNAVTPEQIEEALNNYKLQVRARLAAAAPGAKDALDKAKEDAINEAKGYVKAEIDATINKGKDAAKDAIEANKDKVTDIVQGGKDLNDRITKIENDIQVAKNVAGKVKDDAKGAASAVIAKAPAIKGNVTAKATAAKTYAKTVNAKADAALNLGYQNSQDIITERNDRIQGQRDTLKAANSYTDSRFNSLQSEVDSNRKRAAAGISGVAAMANMPGIEPGADFSIGAGIGGFDGEQSLAVGFQGRLNNNVTTRVSVSSSTGGEAVWGAGIGYSW